MWRSRSLHPRVLLFVLPLLLSISVSAAAEEGHPVMFDVRAHGAKGDGTTVDTAALQAAIDACGQAGGGQVVLPAGRYVSATLRLRSGVELHLTAGARLVGIPDKDAYSGPADDRSNRWLHALLVGEDLHDVAVTGPGVIDGNAVRDPQGEEHMRGPHGLLLRRCRGVRVQDVTFREAGNYAFLFYACEHVQVLDSTFEGGWDGVHFRELGTSWNKDLVIRGCHFYTGDDCIAGSGIEDGVVDRCTINTSCNGVRLIGPSRRFTLTHCTFFGPGRYPHITQSRHNMLAGLALQPSAWDKRPGPMEDLHVSDVTMDGVSCAIHVVIRSGNTGDRMVFERITAKLANREAASSVESWGEVPCGEIVFRDIDLQCAGGGAAELAALPIKAPGVDYRVLPVWGFYARNVASLTLERVRLTAGASDARPGFRADDVARLRLSHVAVSPGAVDSAFVFRGVGEITRDDTPQPPAAPAP